MYQALRKNNLIATGTISTVESACVHQSALVFVLLPSEKSFNVWKVVSLCGVCFVLYTVYPEWQLGFIWETSPCTLSLAVSVLAFV